MSRWLLVSFVVACGGGREVSKVKYTHTSCGPGCEIAPGTGDQKYAPPDEERPPPEVEPPPPPTVGAKPEPTCNLVAETLVSLELGDYADPEERAPKVAAEERRCVAMRLSHDDRQCVIDSHDRASVAYCVPALFPNEKQPVAVSRQRCDVVAKHMMRQLEHYTRSQPVADQRAVERQLLAAIDACRADRWNEAMAQCAENYVPMHAQSCAYVQPSGMWKRLEARLEKAK